MIRRILLTIVLLLATAYLIVAVTAFNRKPADATCTDIELVIKDTVYAGFITKRKCFPCCGSKSSIPSARI